jgi:hypothetical protein
MLNGCLHLFSCCWCLQYAWRSADCASTSAAYVVEYVATLSSTGLPMSVGPSIGLQRACELEPCRYHAATGHAYLLDPLPMTHVGARLSAAFRGGHLAAVTSQAEWEFVAPLLDAEPRPGSNVYLGGVRGLSDANRWTWQVCSASATCPLQSVCPSRP